MEFFEKEFETIKVCEDFLIPRKKYTTIVDSLKGLSRNIMAKPCINYVFFINIGKMYAYSISNSVNINDSNMESAVKTMSANIYNMIGHYKNFFNRHLGKNGFSEYCNLRFIIFNDDNRIESEIHKNVCRNTLKNLYNDSSEFGIKDICVVHIPICETSYDEHLYYNAFEYILKRDDIINASGNNVLFYLGYNTDVQLSILVNEIKFGNIIDDNEALLMIHSKINKCKFLYDDSNSHILSLINTLNSNYNDINKIKDEDLIEIRKGLKGINGLYKRENKSVFEIIDDICLYNKSGTSVGYEAFSISNQVRHPDTGVYNTGVYSKTIQTSININLEHNITDSQVERFENKYATSDLENTLDLTRIFL